MGRCVWPATRSSPYLKRCHKKILEWSLIVVNSLNPLPPPLPFSWQESDRMGEDIGFSDSKLGMTMRNKDGPGTIAMKRVSPACLPVSLLVQRVLTPT